jgi:type I restriction enzyme R subunit
MTTTENQIERDLISKLEDLKYTYRPDIRDRAALEHNFRKHFEALTSAVAMAISGTPRVAVKR